MQIKTNLSLLWNILQVVNYLNIGKGSPKDKYLSRKLVK